MKSIRLKILAMLAIVAAGAILSAIISIYGLHKADDLNNRSDIQASVALQTQRINGIVTAVVMESRGVYMAKNPQEAATYAKGIEDRFPALRKFTADLKKVAPAEERAVVDQIAKAVDEFIVFRTETARLGREVSPAAANEQGNNEANRANRKALNDLLISFSQRVEKASIMVGDEATAFTRQVQWLMPIILLTTLLVSVGVALVFAQRSITRPILDLSQVMDKLTAGDTSVNVPHSERPDEIGAMARAVSVLRQSTEQVALLQEQERAAAAARLARAQSMEAVVSDVGEVVAAAAAGDFSARLQIDDADEQMQRLVAGINEINAVVDGATTEFAGALSAIAGGDLTNRIETGYRGRFADLKGAINETVDRLSATVATIQTTSADVGLAAREISIGADDLSKRTEEQASSLEQTAATTEELAASVKASAQASRSAATAADEAASAARSGGTIAGQAVDAMARIETASQKISDIIRVIDDIAFQTNLLALNAAVEAARAGDAGKGFAVVASEVRTLAQRSSEAAKDISELISSSNAEVGEGVKLVRRAGEALTQILAASQKVAATIADISAASGEQANGIDEMSQAVAHLDEMTQQNAALSEQSAASANSLSGRIEQLNALVATFKTNQGGAAVSRVPASISSAASEPDRLRQLAEAAFHQSRRPAAAKAEPAPVKRAVNARNGSTGWEEF
jgi:methyl-accepting chemotaxis protein